MTTNVPDELNKFQRRVKKSYEDIAADIGHGYVVCSTCGRERLLSQVEIAECLRAGWPKCCGYTMSLRGGR